MKITKSHLIAWNKNYSRDLFVGYALEINPTTQYIKNIVFVTPKSHLIYSFDDSLDHIHAFVADMDWFLPRVADFHQTSLEKLSRKCKL